jgi:hypothetical protein
MTSGMERDTALGGPNGAPRQGDELQSAAAGLIDQAARTAEAQASTTMTRAGETLSTVAAAIRDAGAGLRQDQPDIAGFVDTAAERVESAGAYLREHGAGEAIDNMQQMARRQPALVIGGGIAAGLILGRILRGGASAVQSERGASNWNQGAGRWDQGSSRYGVATGGTSYSTGPTSYPGYPGGAMPVDTGTELGATDLAADAALTDDELHDDATSRREI